MIETTAVPTRSAAWRGVALALALAALAFAGAVTAAAPAQEQPTVRVGSAEVATGETATVGVVLTAAPDGLAGYYLELSVGGDAARIESASYPEQFGLTTDPEIGPDNRTVALEAADVDSAVESGATNVTLAAVEIAGAAPGEVDVSVEPIQFDADGGDAFEPAAQSGAVTVTEGASPTATATPTAAETTATADGDQTEAGDGTDGATATDSEEPDGTGSDGEAAETVTDGESATATPGDGTETTGATGPLSPALALAAIGAAIGLLSRRG